MSETITTPKPGSWVKANSSQSASSLEDVSGQQDGSKSTTPKKPYIRKEHLTDRPFKSEALQQLRDSMQPKKTYKRKNARNK